MKNLTEFINLCNSKVLPTSEMYNFIQEYTNNFDLKSLEYLRNDLNKYTDNVKFTFLEDTVNDGTVDRPTTVFNYLKRVNEIAPFVLTPRQKINLILNDLQEQQINYYDNESIFSYEFNQFLKFSDMVEQEYKDKLQKEPKAPDTNTPTLLIKSLTENQQTFLYNKLTEKSLFLPAGTDFNSFCFVFGNSLQPDNFTCLKWLQNKQLLRELITELKHPNIEKIPKSKYNLPAYFVDTKKKPINYLSPNNPKTNNLSIKLSDISKHLRQTK